MFALRERRIHVRQEDLEMAVAKVSVVLYNHEMYIHVRGLFS